MSAIITELSRGVRQAADLRQRLGVSPATLMRSVRGAGDRVVAIGRGRATRYALREAWPALLSSRFPLFRVGRDGTARSDGELLTLAARQTVWLPTGLVSTGLPVELSDIRPSGFLGRHFSATHADLRLPALLSDWSDHHILLAMSRRGEDLPGDLIVGDESFARWQALDIPPSTRDDYPALANATMAGHPPGSSAGGERPKFGALVDGRHVLVKFASRAVAGAAAARRWCDLLLLEGLALDLVASRDIEAARTTVLDADSHVFLESERFDRVGLRGRVAVLSLAAVQDDPADSWARAATLLYQAGRLPREDAQRLQWLDAFGALIGNTDRHPYNVLLLPVGARLRLAPVFDQVSMLYAPDADGDAPVRTFTMPAATGDTLDVWDDARAAAREFWERAADWPRVSDAMRAACAANARMLRA